MGCLPLAQTDACENITLPQTSFTRGKKRGDSARDCNVIALLYCIDENALCTRREVEALNELNGGKEAFPGSRVFFRNKCFIRS